ncbi:Pyrimidine pathway regulatory protein [Lachnellula subtilissima]|uniref:Pyrimidine pathway regulatory protein n=1 Tax=Lachnellula subtilissima TaxID=602034 RepID=A0A8H8RUS9_9HELO|nr:Pyrimidine pathway regulatory protein [Lachnellula subtilissima]
MICAIACANKSRYMTHLSASDAEFYESGLPHVQAVTSSVSGESLQALLLLVLYCLFHPRKGDIWKLLDYACRLSVELGYHAEPQDSACNDMSISLSLRKNTFWSLYTNEQIVAQIFGRPCDLAGYIISTDYPGTLISGLSPGAEQGLTAHRYRIFYLRGEIYGELFLPTDSAVHSLEWFVQRFVTLSQWFEEIQVDGAEANIETATCDVAFHSTVIILFQPLLICALSDTKEAELDPSARRLIPSENYRSACQLIRTYWNIVRVPHDSALGLYGMTIMSAHYIYLAGLTIMARAQLSIDGRVKSLAPLDAGTLNEVAQQIDYSEIFEISGSCLVLLHWCASRWRGMVGMMDMYKRLSEKLLPLLARSGMA